jgi:hypothetical protein
MTQRNWTTDAHGVSNNSAEFHRVVEFVAEILSHHRLSDDVTTTARLIVAKLAHQYGLELADARAKISA